jgi:hypothetical protein
MYAAIIRFALFLVTNGAILVLISIVFKVFGFEGIQEILQESSATGKKNPCPASGEGYLIGAIIFDGAL